MTRPTPGRPKRGDDRPRASARLGLRLTPAEREALDRAAEECDIAPGTLAAGIIAEWLVRQACRSEERGGNLTASEWPGLP